ncbi:hypothetical protein GCM10022267_19350 [Lentzea roselyniae]|uniref:Regulatory protein, gntR family n=1 Tax=Lentzea roselyniae TaxID=531940 RepID=A0ABP7AI54_9PSEU
MTKRKAGPKDRERGRIEVLPSGSLRVVVYAGVDPLTGLRNYRHETIPKDTPDLWDEAEKTKTRILNEIDEQRSPRTKANVNTLIDRYLDNLDVKRNTRKGYEGYINNHIRPLVGDLPVAKLDGEVIDSLYSTLRTCRAHCGGRKFVEHKSEEKNHDCKQLDCQPHECKPLEKNSVRQVHFCLSGALDCALRWGWIKVNPLAQAKPPKPVKPNPNPPTPEQAAAIVNEAFKDLPWGMFVWLAMTTGARRGEVCALRLDLLDLNNAVLSIQTAIAQDGAETWEQDTKTHQQRRIALDPETVGLLRAYIEQRKAEAEIGGAKLKKDGRVFSSSVDHSTWLKPDTVTQRYRRMCERLGWKMNIHQLRHYSATELIAAGVDVRTVAGRLGHGGGGATTLRVYSAWVSEADQRAAGNIGTRMPKAPIKVSESGAVTTTLEPTADNPYQKIYADLRGAITCGALRPGDLLPTVVELKGRYGLSAGTVNRAIAELKAEGLVHASRGKRAVVLAPGEEPDIAEVVSLSRKRAAK